jgi:heterodisulfide reductase subunit C
MADYVLHSGRVFTDADLAPKALARRKLPFRPHTVVGRDQIKRIFQRFRKGGAHV